MNKKKWRNPNVPMSALALKLSEEAAEVGTEISDAVVNGNGNPRSYDNAMNELASKRDAVLEEISHVEFFCQVLRDRMDSLSIGT